MVCISGDLTNGKYTYWDISPNNHTVDTAQNVTVEDNSIVIPKNEQNNKKILLTYELVYDKMKLRKAKIF